MVSDRFQDAYVPEMVSKGDLEFFDKAEYGARGGWGDSPALLIVDFTKQFVSSEYQLGRSDTGKEALNATQRLLKIMRTLENPVFYTKGTDKRFNFRAYRGHYDEKKATETSFDPGDGNEIHSAVEPREEDVVIEKPRPSAFFDTHLSSMLRYFGIDTLVVAGMTTSGCIRATVVDSFSKNFRTIVPVECVADRSKISHEIELFHMDMKYADVTPLEKVLDELKEY